ncbi:MAG: sigma-70 family RNA polymerase sigma factor, partial [Leptolyngbyaceae cyanobacterium bins.59]|nr:sigma-70 family RNA polymerase sigma factor [Leptolyngbyaceae cyanobacterium bins.59]
MLLTLRCPTPMTRESSDLDIDVFATATDLDLYRQMKAGNTAALEEIYHRYASLVHRLAIRMLSTPEEAEDLTQEIFLYLWRSDTYNPTRGGLGNFLATVTRSRAIDRLRSQSSKFKVLQLWSQAL